MSKNNQSPAVYIIAIVAMLGGIAVYYYINLQRIPVANPVVNKEQLKAGATSKSPASVNEPTGKPKIELRGMTSSTLIQKVLTGQKPLRPDFGLKDMNGKIRYIKEWDGKIVILNFWATWCPPCKREMPAFVDLHNKYKKSGVEVIGIAIDELEAVKQYVEDVDATYTILVGQLDAMTINQRYGNIRGQLPYTVFINRQKQIVAVKRGEITKAEMERAILQLLGPVPSSQRANKK